MQDGCIEDVLLSLDILMHLLSIYYIHHSRDGKTFQFSPYNVTIQHLLDPEKVVSIGIVDHEDHLYWFDGFESLMGSSFISHEDSMGKI